MIPLKNWAEKFFCPNGFSELQQNVSIAIQDNVMN
jgi:hypothetical protein